MWIILEEGESRGKTKFFLFTILGLVSSILTGINRLLLLRVEPQLLTKKWCIQVPLQNVTVFQINKRTVLELKFYAKLKFWHIITRWVQVHQRVLSRWQHDLLLELKGIIDLMHEVQTLQPAKQEGSSRAFLYIYLLLYRKLLITISFSVSLFWP